MFWPILFIYLFPSKKQTSINNYNIRITLVVIRMEKLKKTIRDLLYMRFVKPKQNNKKKQYPNKSKQSN